MNTTPQISRASARSDEDFRAFAVAVTSELELTQEEIADSLHCTQSLVQQMVSYGGARRLPVSFVPLLTSTEKVRHFRYELIKWQAKASGIVVSIQPGELKVDGSIKDEVADFVKALGSIQLLLEKNPEKRVAIDALFLRMGDLIRQMKVEVENGVRS
jgi:predicted transcriptional regulator